MADLDYAKVVGRFALTVGDTSSDVDDDPDTIWCDEGRVIITPLVTYAKVAGGVPEPFTVGNAQIEATVDSEGYLFYLGKRSVHVVDLTSPKVNPQIGPGLATHRVTFTDVRAQGTLVQFPEAEVRFTAAGDENGENDLTLLLPVPTGEATPITQGPRGTGVQTLAVEAGDLVVTLDDGTEVNAGELPVGPGGSDEGVASYLEVEESATTAATRARVAADIETGTGPVASALSASIEQVAVPAAQDAAADFLASDPGVAAAAVAAVDGALAGLDVPTRTPVASRSAWGHSIAKGTTGGATPWTTYLGTHLGATITNHGENGWRSDQIAARQGGAPALMSTSGGAIPSSGTVNVTLPFDIIPSGSLAGRWGGIHGTFTRTGAGTGTFTRTDFGAPRAIPTGAPFVPDDAAAERDRIVYLWAGRNDPTVIPEADTAANVARMVASLTPTEKRVLILEELPSASDLPETTGLARLNRYNTAIRNAFPQFWVPIGQWLRTAEAAAAAGITFTAQDNADIANGITPTSFRYDSLHLNSNGNKAVAWRLWQEEIRRGWTFTDVPTVEPYAADTFTRTAPAGTLGVTEVGELPWTASVPAVWQTNGDGYMRRIAGTASDPVTNTVDTGEADGRISVTNPGQSAGRGLIFRLAADGTGFVFNASGSTWALTYRTAAGSYVSRGSSATPAPTTGHNLAVALDGTSIKCYVDEVEVISAVAAENQTETRHGLWTNATTAAFDNYSHQALA